MRLQADTMPTINTGEKQEVIKLVQMELQQNTTSMEEKLALSKKILLAELQNTINMEEKLGVISRFKIVSY